MSDTKQANPLAPYHPKAHLHPYHPDVIEENIKFDMQKLFEKYDDGTYYGGAATSCAINHFLQDIEPNIVARRIKEHGG